MNDNQKNDHQCSEASPQVGKNSSQGQNTLQGHSTGDTDDENGVRKILDDKYQIIRTIGEGRYAKVKLAIDLQTKKQVAIKIMRVKNMANKKECVECLFTEINILTECRHPNVVKILDASFDGCIVKEQLVDVPNFPSNRPEEEISDKFSANPQSLIKSSKMTQEPSDLYHEYYEEQQPYEDEQIQVDGFNTNQNLQRRYSDHYDGDYEDEHEFQEADVKQSKNTFQKKEFAKKPFDYEQQSGLLKVTKSKGGMKKPNKIEKEYLVVKRKTELCYYVMKLAEYGELYSFIENTEPFNEHMTRYLLDQLLEAICYLHSHGIVHRDIKPENILINKKGKLIIADFSFATRMQEEDSDNILKKKFDPIIEMRHNVGSEIYNAPELWDNQINLHEVEQKLKQQQDKEEIFDYAEIDGKLRSLSVYPKYHGEKADIFSLGATLFMIRMKSPPFRRAVQTDPYYKRLSSTVKQNFWKIFKNISYSSQFRELVERCLSKYPGQRYSLDQIRGSTFFDTEEAITQDQFLEDIKKRYVTVEAAREQNLGKNNHESHSLYYSEVEVDEEILAQDNQDYRETRKKYISQIQDISKMLRHHRNMKKIKKECLKNMVAGPSLIEHSNPLKTYKQNSYSINKKDSMVSQISQHKSTHKNSLVGPSYNSDTEDAKHQDHAWGQSKAMEFNTSEAKNLHQQIFRQSSYDQLQQ